VDADVRESEWEAVTKIGESKRNWWSNSSPGHLLLGQCILFLHLYWWSN